MEIIWNPFLDSWNIAYSVLRVLYYSYSVDCRFRVVYFDRDRDVSPGSSQRYGTRSHAFPYTFRGSCHIPLFLRESVFPTVHCDFFGHCVVGRNQPCLGFFDLSAFHCFQEHPGIPNLPREYDKGFMPESTTKLVTYYDSHGFYGFYGFSRLFGVPQDRGKTSK